MKKFFRKEITIFLQAFEFAPNLWAHSPFSFSIFLPQFSFNSWLIFSISFKFTDPPEAFALFESSPLEYLIGVTEYDFPITLALDKQGDVGKVFFENGYAVTRSQDIPKYYHPNGAIYLATVEAFLRAGTFFQPEMLVHEMDAIRSFDIDYPYQFTMAEELAKQIANNEL